MLQGNEQSQHISISSHSGFISESDFFIEILKKFQHDSRL
jgi:hypothetical protein